MTPTIWQPETAARPRTRAGCKEQRGFSLIELFITIGIVAIGMTIALSAYKNFSDRADNSDAVADITVASIDVERFFTLNGEYPDSLAEVGFVKKDPWGNDYQYWNHGKSTGNGMLRKDKGTVPINSDFDLYSMGEDGNTSTPLTSATGRDDIVRGSNGDFIGAAADY